ncbi:MAG: fatty acid CoA ligase family protein [Pseudomonadota bacterium]|jgi:acyl-CoA synthetase (AMP-forming)/AMP-acid ligase II
MTHAPNIADALREAARAAPDRIAMRIPVGRAADGATRWRELSYRELDGGSERLAAGLAASGIGAGVRTVLMVRPGEPLFLLMFALFKAGAVPVLVDPGIDRGALKACLAEARPEAFIGIPLAQAASVLLGWGKATIRARVTVGARTWFWGGHTLDAVRARGRTAPPARPSADADALAAILFTSGSTGVPKGVEYTHANFIAQVALIRDAFGIAPGEVDLPTFPPFALFDPGLGMTSVIPDMDPTRPGSADPRRLVAAIEEHGCTTMFGSPALLDNLTRFAEAADLRLPRLRRVLSAGAPVHPDVVERTFRMLPADATVWTPYGATECLPVAVIEGREILRVRARTDTGGGICVGRPLPANTVRVIRIDDGEIAEWSDDLVLPPGTIGEITVDGPSATRGYFGRDEATRLAKIRDRGRLVHRMGDVGYFDEDGLLWYCGRKSHRVVTRRGPLYTESIEGIYNAHPAVRRTALVGVGPRDDRMPVLCVELADRMRTNEWPSIKAELRELGERHAVSRGIREFVLHWGFPVDIRHNAKIGRERLAFWASQRVFYKPWQPAATPEAIEG